MRKVAAALAAVVLLLSACHDHTSRAAPLWQQPSPAVTFPALPSGLVATAQVGDRTELRVYSAADGRLLHRFALPPVDGAVSFSDDFGYAIARRPAPTSSAGPGSPCSSPAADGRSRRTGWPAGERADRPRWAR